MGIYDYDGYLDKLRWTSQFPISDVILKDGMERNDSVPEKFDLRDNIDGQLTVRDKGKTPEGIGICWLFAALDVLETHLLYKECLKQNPLLPQSSLHGAYATFDISDNDPVYVNPRGRKPGTKASGKPAYGGYPFMAINYLTRDVGTVPEVTDPYYKQDMQGQVLPKRKWDITEQKPGDYYIKEIRYLQDPIPAGGDPDYIASVKNHILRYGGIACSIFWKDDYLRDLGNNHYSYFDNTTGCSSNHAVAIIGWDDQYPVGNFKNAPKSAGAYLVKNCWRGIPGGEYVWVSYESANFGANAYCIARVGMDMYSHPYRILQHDFYGYNDLYVPYSDGTRTMKAKNSFTAADGDRLSGISFYACNASYVSLSYETGKSAGEISIVEDYACPAPGYYTYDLPNAVQLPPGVFSVIVTYYSATNLPAYIPLEINDDDKIYIHWDVQKGRSYIWENDSWTDIFDLGDGYGYFCMKAIVENTSDSTKKRKEAYNALCMPTAHDGYTEVFPQTINGLPVSWRLEPYQASSYSKTYSGNIAMYKVGSGGNEKYGLVNKGNCAETAYVTAIIGSGKDCMRKIFHSEIGVNEKKCEFTVGEIEEHDNCVLISGSYGIVGAVVCIQANGQEASVEVQSDQTWSVKKFRLYDASQGWKKEYENTQITVQIKTAEGYLLAECKKNVAVKCPADKEDNNWMVYTAVGLTVAVIAGGLICLCQNIEYSAAAGAAGGSLLGGDNVEIDGQNHRIRVEDDGIVRRRGLMRTARKVDGVVVEYTELPQNHNSDRLSDAAEEWGGIIHHVSKGGSVKNCRVCGSVSDAGRFGGLFYDGEDVTVENCTVDLQVNGGDTFAGVAMNLKGNAGTIRNVGINGNVTAGRVAGVATDMEGGSINNVSVTGSYNATNGTAAGIALNMAGGTISDCRVSAVLSGTGGACGVAANMQPGAKISNSYSACHMTAADADAWVCGIARGVENAAESISGCVVAGSHFSGAHTARVSAFPSNKYIAYEAMTCDGSFADSGVALKAAAEFHTKALYEQIGWDFTKVWDMDSGAPFPVLKENSVKQYYDYPFPYPLPPESGKFVYQTGQTIAILGKCSVQLGGKMTWSLSPHGVGSQPAMDGNVMRNQDDFYLQIAALPVAGEYDLVLFGVLEGHKYGITILLEVQDKKE